MKAQSSYFLKLLSLLWVFYPSDMVPSLHSQASAHKFTVCVALLVNKFSYAWCLEISKGLFSILADLPIVKIWNNNFPLFG